MTAAPARPDAPTQAPRLDAGGPRNEGEKLCHLVEAHEPDRALCGKDVTGYPWNPPWPYCVVCLDLAEGLPHWRATVRALRGA
ncbi:MAG TPA: hypothetical protein VF712_15470 [Thermoleophilaceae bacterium]